MPPTRYQNNFVLCSVIVAFLVRWLVAQWPYSGEGSPPMFGDLEAQRHWMEVTVNLDHRLWYKNSSQNDLNYWGLDYPPLSAYHMFVNGKVAAAINKSWVALNSSRGMESPTLKTFMRSTVIISDLVIFLPAVLAIWSSGHDFRSIICLLFYPALILIDHGHFQYNCVSLGLTLWSLHFIFQSNYAVASVFFSMALNYKQISMYHSTAFFFFLLGRCFHASNISGKIIRLTLIASSVLLTFAIIWTPFLSDPINEVLPVLKRLVPVERGLFEDKVANVWCSLEPIVKVRRIFDHNKLFWMSFLATLAALLPTGIHLLLNPSIKNFKYSLVTTSLSFFLFSFQVHEKGILLVGLPVGLLFQSHPYLCAWFYFVSTMSLQPLLVKDGLMIPMVALTSLFVFMFFALYARDLSLEDTRFGRIKITLALASFFGYFVLILSSLISPPIKKWPDLYPVLISSLSCGHFIIFYLIFSFFQVRNPKNKTD